MGSRGLPEKADCPQPLPLPWHDSCPKVMGILRELYLAPVLAGAVRELYLAPVLAGAVPLKLGPDHVDQEDLLT